MSTTMGLVLGLVLLVALGVTAVLALLVAALGIVAAYTLFGALWSGAWRRTWAFWLAMPLIGVSLGLALAAEFIHRGHTVIGCGTLIGRLNPNGFRSRRGFRLTLILFTVSSFLRSGRLRTDIWRPGRQDHENGSKNYRAHKDRGKYRFYDAQFGI